MIFKIESVRLDDDHVADVVYCGEDAANLAFAGMLRHSVGSWQTFGALLLLGAKQTNGRETVILEGDVVR